ncbi:MAG: hypothetical protein ACXACY_19290 [Candidatus Hodarchaeales archaeon]|jgi:hypothetical protein
MEKIIITVVLLIIAAVFKALMDLSSEDRFNKLWLNKESWIFKWKHKKVKNGEQVSRVLTGWRTKHWWYLGLKTTKYPERFPFSSTRWMALIPVLFSELYRISNSYSVRSLGILVLYV